MKSKWLVFAGIAWGCLMLGAVVACASEDSIPTLIDGLTSADKAVQLRSINELERMAKRLPRPLLRSRNC